MSPAGTGPDPRPPAPLRWAEPESRAAIVVPTWDTGTEGEVAVRALAGVLARSHRVDVVVRHGTGRPPRRDGALQVVELTGEPPSAATRAVLRQALAAAAADARRAPDWLPEPAATILDGPEAHAWQLAAEHVERTRPQVVVVAGGLGAGAFDVLDAAPDPAATVALPLVGLGSDAGDATRDVLRTAGTVLATSSTEAAWVRAAAGVDAVEVGTHLPANPFSLSEPPGMVAPDAYVAVVDAVGAVGDSALAHDRVSGRRGPAVTVGGWLQSALHPMAVAAVDGADIVTWQRGHAEAQPVVTSRSDLWRLLAFARAVVVVEPGPVLARSTLEALLHGTPVVTPAGTLAAGHVTASGGGLVADGDAELLAAVQVLVADGDAAATLGAAGQHWALPRYGDVDAYARRVAEACRVPSGQATP